MMSFAFFSSIVLLAFSGVHSFFCQYKSPAKLHRIHMSSPLLFSPTKLGKFSLQNRIVMAPLTRGRAEPFTGMPTSLMTKYYGQRSSAGLIISEGTAPSPNGQGYARIPGMYNAEQAHKWKEVTSAIRAGGCKSFMQLWHTGRVGHPLNLPEGAVLLAPSAIAISVSGMHTDQSGKQPYPVPKAMTKAEIDSTVAEYATSAALAMDAGFDGVEIHGANGYLIDQFFNPKSNIRTDEYGGSVVNRMRFGLEVARAVIAKIGADKVGYRISPHNAFNDLAPEWEGQDQAFADLAKELDALDLLYLHVLDSTEAWEGLVKPVLPPIRANFKKSIILNGGYDAERAEADLTSGAADLIAFGRHFISNPDLPKKLASKEPLVEADVSLFYTPGEKGYTDYV